MSTNCDKCGKPLTQELTPDTKDSGIFPYTHVIGGADYRKRREIDWVGIIIHHTGVGGREQIDDEMWAKLGRNLADFLSKKDDNYVSSHFIISRDGVITQMIDPDKYEAFHAGVSEWWHPEKLKFVEDWNRYAVGVELVGDGNLHEYSDAQYESLVKLCRDLMAKYPSIHPLCVTAHQTIAWKRKVDPGKKFDWRRLFAGLYK